MSEGTEHLALRQIGQTRTDFAIEVEHWARFSSNELEHNMEDIEYPEPNSRLGERLLVGVRNLWAKVKELEASRQHTDKVVDHQGAEIEQIKKDVLGLRSEIRGLKISRGRALAKNARLAQQIAAAESGLSEIERQVH